MCLPFPAPLYPIPLPSLDRSTSRPIFNAWMVRWKLLKKCSRSMLFWWLWGTPSGRRQKRIHKEWVSGPFLPTVVYSTSRSGLSVIILTVPPLDHSTTHALSRWSLTSDQSIQTYSSFLLGIGAESSLDNIQHLCASSKEGLPPVWQGWVTDKNY